VEEDLVDRVCAAIEMIYANRAAGRLTAVGVGGRESG
jgi:hypothetical protein